MIQPLDAWRASMLSTWQPSDPGSIDVYYTHISALSYRFECALCRHARRRWQKTYHTNESQLANQRLQSALLELDAIMMRVLASGSIEQQPTVL
jgi:hypothetical protein